MVAILLVALLIPIHAGWAKSAGEERAFTVADEIGVAQFGDPYSGESKALQVSPDGRWLAVDVKRGRLDLNRPEDILHVYRGADAAAFLRRPQGGPPVSHWSIIRSTTDIGPIISYWQWLANSSELAFLERGENGARRLVVANLEKKTTEPLSPAKGNVTAFEVRDRTHFAFTLASLRRSDLDSTSPSVVGTGRTLRELTGGTTPLAALSWGELWAALDGTPRQVTDAETGQPVILSFQGAQYMALSPDGQTLATSMLVADIPKAWETLYPPPFPAHPRRLRAGRQSIDVSDGRRVVSRYVLIDLKTQRIRSLGEGPTAAAAGWTFTGRPTWSDDGRTLLLPGAFLPSDQPSRPCLTRVDIASGRMECLQTLKDLTPTGLEEGYRSVKSLQFAPGTNDRVWLRFNTARGERGAVEYRRSVGGSWEEVPLLGAPESTASGIEFSVREGLDEPPVLVARDVVTNISEVLLDPNPQLKDTVFGDVSVVRWTGLRGKALAGGLYKPPGYQKGQRYPLVIQTHGFMPTQYRPSGMFPTAFAARALAGAGIMVLQAPQCQAVNTPEEGACEIANYEGAVEKLDAEGLIDPARIGIIGFSRTCFHVMEALTKSKLSFAAASITDGTMQDYWRYLVEVDGTPVAAEANTIFGAPPFGAGLQNWLKSSPLFNADKITAPLLVNAVDYNLLSMWGPYAALRYMRKPVDLIVLNAKGEHVFTNPAIRMASQGGSVDWFRFWLQNYEDPDPAKAEQYDRWRKLRELQCNNGQPAPAGCAKLN